MAIGTTNISLLAVAQEVQSGTTNISLNSMSIRALSSTSSENATSIGMSGFSGKTGVINYLAANEGESTYGYLIIYKAVRNSGVSTPRLIRWASYGVIGNQNANRFPAAFTPDGTVLAVFNGTASATTKQITLFTKSSAGTWSEASTTTLDATVNTPISSYPLIAWDNTGTYLGLGGGSGYNTGSSDYVPGYFMKRSGTTLTVLSSPTTVINGANHATYGPVVWNPSGSMFLIGNVCQTSTANYPLSRYTRSADTFTYVADQAPTPPDGSAVWDMAFSPDGTKFFIQYSTWAGVNTYRTYTVSGTTFTLVNTYTTSAYNISYSASGSATYSPSGGKVILTSDTDNRVYSYSVSGDALSISSDISLTSGTLRGKWIDGSYVAQGNSYLNQYSGEGLSAFKTYLEGYRPSPQSSTSKAVPGQQ